MPMPIRNLMRAMNRATVLDIIRASGMISRIDIARTTGLSQALVTGLTADLIKEGLIIEKKTGESEGGRKPILLSLNPDGAYVIGVNLTISEVSAAIANFEASVIASLSLPLEPIYHSAEDITDCDGWTLADGTKIYLLSNFGSSAVFFFNAPVLQGE